MNAVQRVPIINLHSNLIVPIQGFLPDASYDQLQEEVTRRIVDDGAEGVVLDVSAVASMDSYFTRVVRDLAVTARLMGARTVLCGVPATVAITMVEMGLSIRGVATALDLERALEYLDDVKAHGDPDELFAGADDDYI
jgi:rsbT antagonist protein RsbS